MDELIKQGQWWWLLIPLGTGLFALGGSWLGAFLGRSHEHKQWLRDSKQAAYAEFLSAIVEATSTLNPAIEAREAQRRATVALSQIRLIGAQSVTAAAVSLSAPVNDMHRLNSNRRGMIELDYSANEDEILAIGPRIEKANNEVPTLTKAFVQAARLDVGTKIP
ncbi:hypothetical protein J2790_003935 [Paenarthrobacter nicotinovorans]|uniref:hypothetical protein n=1 Tax=Micrococcaceae TaxID=1268 RepID=UPI0008771C6C|nr:MULTISPECIES: hypothetical protein [Micrococcaceae]MDR6438768.1 hypothetical protein [Paenarthrobacter nicotinovorans]SCZ56361.1 hypothetical protein SAMN02799638_01804 [Arthrobacter sp. UNCCL28]